MSIWAFAGPENEEAALRAALLGSAILVRGGPLIDSFNAAGVCRAPFHGRALMPYLAVDADRVDFPPGEQPPFGYLRERHPHLAGLLVAALEGAGDRDGTAPGVGPGWLDDVLVWVLPPPQPRRLQVQQADVGVSWSGCRGFLTAGHVARMNAGPVTAAGVTGSVRVSIGPAGSGARPQADAALVEYTNPPPVPAPGPRPLAPTPMADDVLTYETVQQRRDIVKGYSLFYKSGWINGTYGEVYQTAGGVSVGGDSGALVTNAQGEVVGSLVAGASGHCDLVQSIQYQMSQLGVAGLTVV